MDIVPADIPALLGLDILDGESLFADTVTNRLIKRVVTSDEGQKLKYGDLWSTPLTRHEDHVYAAMGFSNHTFFTTAQLEKLHRQFAYPSATKLFNLLKRARLEDTSPETLKALEDLSKRCDPCQRIQHAPRRFRVLMGAEDVRSNEKVLMDVMYLDGKPVLHVVDEGTRFSAARFLSGETTRTVWETFLECWASIYTGLPHTSLVGQGSSFGRVFASTGSLSSVKVERTGVEAHSSLNVGERYHEPLRTTYRKLKNSYPKLQPRVILCSAVKAMNDTLGPEGLVPSSLVFEEYPSVRTMTDAVDPKASLSSRAELAMAARKEMSTIMARMKVNRALRHTVPPAANEDFEPGQQVLVWREKQVENRVGEWMGPFTVVSVEHEKKLVLIRESDKAPAKPFGSAQVKHYISPERLASAFFADIKSSVESFCSPPEDSIYLTEIIERDDPRARSPEMREARRKEIKGLIERGTFKVILREEVPDGANVLTARFVLAIKSTEDGKIKYKARYVVGGHRDKLKNSMVHSSQTLQPSSARLILALAAMMGFYFRTADVTQAYLQSSEPLMREVFLKNPVPEFELDGDQCLKVFRPLYGLCESGDLWHATLDKRLRSDLGMSPMRSDPALYTLIKNGLLEGLSGSYVDDLLRTGTDEFKIECRRTHETFEMSDAEELPCTFAGFQISGDKENGFTVDQNQYLRQLEELPASAVFPDFRSMRMKLAWMSNSRPDCFVEISQLAQVAENMFSKQSRVHLKHLNRAVRYAVSHPLAIHFPRLDADTLRIVGYSDASFANNHDLTSQLGYIVLLMDARRVTSSVMAAEVIAFSDLFDVAFTLGSELKVFLSRDVPIQLLTDSKCLFDVISKGSRTSEKRVMLDIAATREGYRQHRLRSKLDEHRGWAN